MAHIDDLDLAVGRALNALPPHEEKQVDEHVKICADCDEHLREVQEAAHFLAFVAQPVRPPHHCKSQLMQRIEDEIFLTRPIRRSASARMPYWSGWLVAGALSVLLLGWNMQMRRALTQARMSEAMFVAAPQTRPLLSQDQAHRSTTARLYMSPKSNYMLLVIENLEPAPAGKVYQIWVANESEKRAINAFHVAAENKPMIVHPPESLSKYKWIMITVEDADDVTPPEGQTILQGDL